MLKLSLVFFAFIYSNLSFADSDHQKKFWNKNYQTPAQKAAIVSPNLLSQHSLAIDVLSRRRQVHFLEVSNMKVVKILPEDTNGNHHQKWQVQLADGKLMTVVYNSSICPKIEVQVGDTLSAAGALVWSREHKPILHWVHHDPKFKRPHGYVEYKGQKYCFDKLLN